VTSTSLFFPQMTDSASYIPLQVFASSLPIMHTCVIAKVGPQVKSIRSRYCVRRLGRVYSSRLDSADSLWTRFSSYPLVGSLLWLRPVLHTLIYRALGNINRVEQLTDCTGASLVSALAFAIQLRFEWALVQSLVFNGQTWSSDSPPVT